MSARVCALVLAWGLSAAQSWAQDAPVRGRGPRAHASREPEPHRTDAAALDLRSDGDPSTPAPPASQAREASRLLAGFEREPDIAAVQEAAARFVGADPSRVRSWRARVRHAAWLPELRVRVQKGYEDDLLATATGHSRATDDDLVFEVQARWRFDRLLFDRNELFVSREATLLADLRREITAEVTRLYFQRRRLQVELRLASAASPRVHAHRVLRLQELTAELDAMTGGYFRRALATPASPSAPKSQPQAPRRLP